MTKDANESNAIFSQKIGDHVSILRRGSKWYANYQFNGKQVRKSLRTRNLKEARRKALLIEAELLEGRHVETIKAKKIEEVTAAYVRHLESQQRRRKTVQKVELVIRRVKDLAAKRRAVTMKDIDLQFADAYRQHHIDEMQKKRNKKPAGKTLHNEMTILKQLVKFANQRKFVDGNSLQDLKLGKAKPAPQPCWDRVEVERILGAAAPSYRPALTLLAETGMRVGELEWLTWDDVDLERKVIHVRAKDDWKPKTGDQRAIPMSELARQTIQAQPRKCRWVFTMPKSWKEPEGNGQMKERRLLRSLKLTLQKLGLVGKLHTFRHSFISHAITKGVPEAIVRQWVGHVDQDILRLYTHINNRDSSAAMQRLSREKGSPAPASDRQSLPAEWSDG
jgi:integrase